MMGFCNNCLFTYFLKRHSSPHLATDPYTTIDIKLIEGGQTCTTELVCDIESLHYESENKMKSFNIWASCAWAQACSSSADMNDSNTLQ